MIKQYQLGDMIGETIVAYRDGILVTQSECSLWVYHYTADGRYQFIMRINLGLTDNVEQLIDQCYT